MESAHDKIAAGLEDAIGMTEIDSAVADAMGEAWAKTTFAGEDDLLTSFEKGRVGGSMVNEVDIDIYCECMNDGQTLLRNLRALGFDIVKLETTHA